MRNQINFLSIVFCLLWLGCGPQVKEPESFGFKPPTIVEAKMYKSPLEKPLPPEVVPVSGVEKKGMGRPEKVYLKSNTFPARAVRKIKAGTPKLLLPEGEGYTSPKVVAAIDSPFIAGRPEIILVKEPFINIKETNFETFSTLKAIHGLQSNEISSLCKDKAGNLWIGAWWGGVSKYDGRFLTNYSVAQGLSNDVVSYLMEDKGGNIWIATAIGGLNKFDGRSITHYSTSEGLSDNDVRYMLEDKNGDIWIATSNGLNRYDGHSFTHYTTAQGLPGNNIGGIFEDSKGNLWVGANGGLTMFNGNSFTNHTTSLELEETTEVGNMVEDNQGNLWFGSSIGLWKYDGNYLSQFTTETGLSSNLISRIMKESTGNIWIGTWDHGANKYDGESFVHYGVDQGLGSDMVTEVLEDKHGIIWLATTAGVSKYDGNLFSHFVPLRQEEVECVFADTHGNIWIGTGAGKELNKYDGNSMSRYTAEQGLSSTSINYILEDREGNIWFGSRGGVDKYDGTYLTNYSTRNGLINDAVFCLLEDRNGNLWFGTNTGLSKFDGYSFTNYSIEQGLKGLTIYSLLEDHHGNIWIGTDNKGVYVFDGSAFRQYDPAYSLSHPMVLGMMEDKDNNIWFCTAMGVNKFDGKYFTWYTTEQGLSNNITKNLLEDTNGNIWIGTINGMNMLKTGLPSLGNPKNTKQSLFKKYTVSEGFLGGGTYENSITQDSKGNIWIGATDRVARYHPEGDFPDTIPPNLQFRELGLFNEDINWLEIEKKKDCTIVLSNGLKLRRFKFSGLTPWYNQPENLQLNYDTNYLIFKFIGITTYRPREVRYQYILEGLDDNWSTITAEPEATYSNLPHGKYTFKAKAVNSEGYWSKELNYSFAIRPPWWSTPWAYLAYSVSFGALIWMFTWYRSAHLKAENARLEKIVEKRKIELEKSLGERFQLIKKIESQEALIKERLRISRELHDDIGSTLSSISIYSEVAKKRSAKKENTNEVLTKIGYASRELIDKMSDIVWYLNPKNEGFEQLQNRMMAFAAMILAPRHIQYDFIADEDLRSFQFSGDQRKNIFLIFKEALHNIAKYASCKTVCVSFSKNETYLIMEIKDDGKGFDVSPFSINALFIEGESLGGNGIKNMHSRADDLNAELIIHSKINRGTTILLTMQL